MNKGKMYILIIIMVIAIISGYIGGRAGQKEAEYRAKEHVLESIQKELDFNKREHFSLKGLIFGY